MWSFYNSDSDPFIKLILFHNCQIVLFLCFSGEIVKEIAQTTPVKMFKFEDTGLTLMTSLNLKH